MLFEKKLMPDYLLTSFKDITPQFMKKIGAAALISDIDNTLVPYEIEEATDEIVNWVSTLRKSDITVSFVSNNCSERVEKFNERLKCSAYANVKKPSVKYIKAACEASGHEPNDTLFLGDQLLTDALAAHRCGIRVAIVPPIKDKTTVFFKLKRLIEKPYLKKYRKIHRIK